MGTARIGVRPSGPGSALPTARCSGVAGLYVADGSLFPTSVGVNPMMTIIAFSKRVAAGIAAARKNHCGGSPLTCLCRG